MFGSRATSRPLAELFSNCTQLHKVETAVFCREWKVLRCTDCDSRLCTDLHRRLSGPRAVVFPLATVAVLLSPEWQRQHVVHDRKFWRMTTNGKKHIIVITMNDGDEHVLCYVTCSTLSRLVTRVDDEWIGFELLSHLSRRRVDWLVPWCTPSCG